MAQYPLVMRPSAWFIFQPAERMAAVSSAISIFVFYRQEGQAPAKAKRFVALLRKALK